MTARTRHRGHPIHWTGHKWVYTHWDDTTMLQHGRERPCTACGNRSEEGGPDYCLGELPAVKAACCGHGFPEEAYFVFVNGQELRGPEAVRLQECWIHNCVTPNMVIGVYLRVLDVETTYRLCQMRNTGAVTRIELIEIANVIRTSRRKSFDTAALCDILGV